MKRKFLTFLVTLVTSIGPWIILSAQVLPTIDPNYINNDEKSDEFNDSTLDILKWRSTPIPNNCIGLGAYCTSSNVNVNGGYLRLKLTEPSPNDPNFLYRMGQMSSKNHDYSYGYFEISAKLVDPGYYNSAGQPILNGIWPSFWLFYVIPGCNCYHDELDVVDNLFGDNCVGNLLNNISPSEDTKYVFGGALTKIPNSTDPNVTNCVDGGSSYYYKNERPLFESEHRFGIEWLLNTAYYYLDGKLVGQYSGFAVPQSALYVAMGMQFRSDYFDTNIPLPQEYQIDYFRYYQLITDYCNQDAYILNNNQLDSFLYGVRQNIYISSPSSSVSLTYGDHKIFRAKQDFLISGDFFVPLGAELDLIPTPCN